MCQVHTIEPRACPHIRPFVNNCWNFIINLQQLLQTRHVSVHEFSATLVTQLASHYLGTRLQPVTVCSFIGKYLLLIC